MSNGRANILHVSEPEGLIEHAEDIKSNTYYQQQESVDAFRVVKKLEIDPAENVKFTHDIFMARRQVGGVEAAENHFVKSIEEEGFSPAENKVEARAEVMGLRYARLGDRNQPCSRYVLDDDKKKHLVASMEIPGFRPFSTIPKDEIRENILNNVFKGAGGKFFLRWALDDHDFNMSNGGVDQNNNVIILDGGWYFGTRYKKYPNKITEKDFQNFPWLTDFQPQSFLDHILTFKNKNTKIEYTRIGEGKVLSKKMITHPQFRHDFFEAALQFIVMPDLFTTQFALVHIADSAMLSACDQTVHVIEEYIQPNLMASYLAKVPTKSEKNRKEEEKGNFFVNRAIFIGKLVLERKLQMRRVALQCREFTDYLRSPQATLDLEKYIASLEQYALLEKDPIFTYVPNLKQSIKNIFIGMQLVNQQSQILCQKVIRLTDPSQPNTLFAHDEKANALLSLAPNAGITLFSEMKPLEIKQNIISGKFKGAGSVFFWRWALDSYEFNLQHVGVDKTGKVLSLEAGLYLGRSVRYYNNKITQKDFDHFPLFEDADPKIFLDYISSSQNPDTGVIAKRKGQGDILSVALLHNPQFQHEYYEAVLQFILMPDAFFYGESEITYQNVAEQVAEKLAIETKPQKTKEIAKDRAEKLILRRNQMQAVALQSKKFLHYLKSATASSDLVRYVNLIEQFAAADNDHAIVSLPEFIKNIKNAFINLRLFHNKELKQNRNLLPTKKPHYMPLCRSPLETLQEQEQEEVDQEEKIEVLEQKEELFHEEKKAELIVRDELPRFLPPLIEDEKQNDPPIEAIVPIIKASEPKESFAWGALIKGAIGTFITGGIIGVGLMAYGVLSVTTLGANIGLTVALSASVCLLGGLVKVILTSKPYEMGEQPKEIVEEKAIVPSKLDDKQEEAANPMMCPPLVPFYRADSGSSYPINLVGEHELDGALEAHELATQVVRQEDSKRGNKVADNLNDDFGLPKVVVVQPMPGLDRKVTVAVEEDGLPQRLRI